ncbi:C40 family peptidase [Bilifractor sp. LCP19S3_H10]|uniref:C40 family peptidase n=1 Tax=Bilifractor sp. LCP19S3_H10 TaxID=3438736 RepID=UPI003F930A35
MSETFAGIRPGSCSTCHHPGFPRYLRASGLTGGRNLWGGNDIYNGCDCSGLVQQIYARVGISLPRVAEAQSQVGTKITPASAQPGDLIFYAENGYIYHVAIYAGEGKTVEAYGTDYGILSTTAFSGRPVCWCTNVIDELN